MIEKIELPLNPVETGEIPFPVTDSRSQARLTRERNNAMQMIRHEQHEPTMPFKMAMIIGGGRKDGLAHAGPAELVLSPRCAVEGDKKETAFRNPLRNLVGQTKPLRILHTLVLGLPAANASTKKGGTTHRKQPRGRVECPHPTVVCAAPRRGGTLRPAAGSLPLDTIKLPRSVGRGCGLKNAGAHEGDISTGGRTVRA